MWIRWRRHGMYTEFFLWINVLGNGHSEKVEQYGKTVLGKKFEEVGDRWN
jgi:hypothetical protein